MQTLCYQREPIVAINPIMCYFTFLKCAQMQKVQKSHFESVWIHLLMGQHGSVTTIAYIRLGGLNLTPLHKEGYTDRYLYQHT